MSRTMGIIVALAVLVAAIIVGVVALHSGPEPDSDITANTPAPMPPGGAEDAMDAEHIEQAQALLSNGLKWLLEQQTDGGWGEGLARPAYTAMAIKALVQHPDFDSQSPPVRDALATLMEYRHDDGSFQAQGKANYTTSLAVMALAAVDDPQYAGATQDAVAYLKGIQIRPGDETPDGQQITEDHPFRGGTSYGSHGRPDLSNLSMTAAAMEAADVPDDDEFWQEATIFLQRTQNRSESNDLNWVRDAPDDGGFIYAPAHRADQLATPESKAGDRGRRSYGSMTYAGFMSMLYAGVGQDDPRVRAAYDWIRRYWRLDSNPNMPHEQSHQGLYYYYHTFAKALRAWGEPVITDTDGVEHNWRHELVGALAERVNDDGGWVNEKAERWLEGDPLLATLYSVLALEEVLK